MLIEADASTDLGDDACVARAANDSRPSSDLRRVPETLAVGLLVSAARLCAVAGAIPAIDAPVQDDSKPPTWITCAVDRSPRRKCPNLTLGSA
jgi:hypothetical protein